MGTASYVALWAAVAVEGLVLVGALRQIGLLRLQLRPAPTVERDGPPIGSQLTGPVALEVERAIGSSPESAGRLLVMIMSPFCQSCQDLVEPLNALEAGPGALAALVVFRSDAAGCRAFLAVHNLQTSVVCDENGRIAAALGVARSPFGLLYADGRLVRKGATATGELLSALLGDQAAAERAGDAIYPQPVVSGTAV